MFSMFTKAGNAAVTRAIRRVLKSNGKSISYKSFMDKVTSLVKTRHPEVQDTAVSDELLKYFYKHVNRSDIDENARAYGIKLAALKRDLNRRRSSKRSKSRSRK